ncbi:MAG TPA: O-antigen translocase [Saprospiraceae bacterium]|nr:O-antigen translocase [Saprospiraceae bacterium]
MNFYKVGFLSGLFSVVNLITGLVITKITASLIGPVGTAYIGTFANITGMILVVATASIGTGIVRYVAQYRDDEVMLKKVVNTASGMILTGSVIASLFVFISFQWLNDRAFEDRDFGNVFLLYGLFLVIIAMQVLITGMLNGLGEIKWLTAVNIAASLLNLMFTVVFILRYDIAGALFSNSLFGIFTTLTGVLALYKLKLLRKDFFRPVIHRELAIGLVKYGLFAAITTFSWMASMLLIRNYVQQQLSVEEAGLWQAMFSLSDRYMNVIINVLIVYFLPRLSEIRETAELVREIRKGFKRIVPLMILISGSIWLCRDLIITILLAESFRPMRDLFAFQMIGDVFRITALLLAYLIASRAMFRSGLKADLGFHISLVASSWWLINRYGLIGATYAYAMSTVIYLMFNLYIFKDLMVLIKKSVLPKPWIRI